MFRKYHTTFPKGRLAGEMAAQTTFGAGCHFKAFSNHLLDQFNRGHITSHQLNRGLTLSHQLNKELTLNHHQDQPLTLNHNHIHNQAHITVLHQELMLNVQHTVQLVRQAHQVRQVMKVTFCPNQQVIKDLCLL